jgi:quercetin dioxygenase-like cupin family protein
MNSTPKVAGTVVDVRAKPTECEQPCKTTILVHGEALEIMRMHLGRGDEVPSHQCPGETVIECVEGHVALELTDGPQELCAGQLICLAPHAPHGIRAIDESLLIVTSIAERHYAGAPDGVEEASEESFPASDAPSFSPVVGSANSGTE